MPSPSPSSSAAFDSSLGFHYASQGTVRIGSHPADRSNMDAYGRTILATPSKHPRLICLDALRGTAIMAMIVAKGQRTALQADRSRDMQQAVRDAIRTC